MSSPDPIERARKFLFDNETRYLRAKEYIKSEQYTADKLKALEKIKSVSSLVDTSHEKALWILGRIAQIIEDDKEAENLIAQYESTKQSVLRSSGGK